MRLRGLRRLNDKKVRKIIFLILIVLGILMLAIASFKYIRGLGGYDFSIDITEAEDKASLTALIDEYASANNIKIDKIDGADRNGRADILIIQGDKEGYTPIDFKGYGLIYDKSFLEDLVESDKSKALADDLKVCTSSEFASFVKAVSKYIESGEATDIKLKTNPYKIGSGKPVKELSLNGVFSFAGGDRFSYANRLLNIAFNDYIFDSAQDKEPIFEAYINLLDLMTSNLAGEFAPAIRGNDLLKDSYYSKKKAQEIFMTGKAFFLLADNGDFEELYELNAEKSENLDMIPVKIKGINKKKIPAQVFNSIGLTDKKNNKEARDFFEWYKRDSEGKHNSLDKAVYSYIKKNRTMNFNIENEAFEAWIDNIFGEEGISSYIIKEAWGREEREQMLLFMSDKWDNV